MSDVIMVFQSLCYTEAVCMVVMSLGLDKSLLNGWMDAWMEGRKLQWG